MFHREAVEGFASAAELGIDRREIRLHLVQRFFNGWKIEDRSFPIRLH
jgi:hypothetical protein